MDIAQRGGGETPSLKTAVELENLDSSVQRTVVDTAQRGGETLFLQTAAELENLVPPRYGNSVQRTVVGAGTR